MLLAAAAVLGGVVEDVQHHLLEPARVAGDEGQVLVRGLVPQLHAVVAKQLAVGEADLLEQRGGVDLLEIEREAPVAHARELQKLLDHAGQPARLAGDYLNPAAGVSLERLVVEQRLAPAGDGRERGAQLVRDGGDELVLHAVGLAYLDATCRLWRRSARLSRRPAAARRACRSCRRRCAAPCRRGRVSGSSPARGTRGCSKGRCRRRARRARRPRARFRRARRAARPQR